jgi:ubiquinone/menaquinone biosynthesis C-methylase UbiE
MMNEKIKAFYDDSAPIFDEEQEEFAFVRVPEKELVMNAFDQVLAPQHSVLEIGAGTGRFTLTMAPRVKHITAVDMSQNMLDLLVQKKEQNKLDNIDTIHGNFMDIDFGRRFDVIVSIAAIEYINDKDALFKKIGDLLAPGGRLLITTAHNTFFRWWGRMGNYFRQKIFMRAYSKRHMRRLLKANGLEVIEMKDLCMKTWFTRGILLFVHAAK